VTDRTRHRRRSIERFYPAIGLVVIVLLAAFVYVSYTANQGLPFAATYDLRVQVPNANRLIATDEVRIGGVRVGQVASVSARLSSNGRPYAVLGLALSPSTAPLAVDTRVSVQSSSLLGQTYVDLRPGQSPSKLASGGTLPLRDATGTVELTDLLDVFDRATSAAIQRTIGNLGASFAGRGAALNDTIGSLARLLPPFTMLSTELASPASHLAGFLNGYEMFAGALAPVASQLGDLVAGASTTFGAVASVRPELGAAIDALPPAESATTDALHRLSGPLSSLASLTVRLRAAGALLPETVSRINSTLTAGVPDLRSLPAFSSALRGSLRELGRVSRAPTTPGALRKLTDALTATDPLLGLLTPAQLSCNVIGLWGRNFSSAWGTLGNGDGPSVVNAGVVTGGATGENLQSAQPAANLHVNYLPNENTSECESGNEPWRSNAQDLSNPPGEQSRSVPHTSPPAGVRASAERAGLLNAPPGTPR
jgi:phospholipid/cholesterol/gamma-HCH transport system substrate-binding protein